VITRLPPICLTFALVSTSLLLNSNAVAQQQSCVVKGNTLTQARASYDAQCTLPRVDCDPIEGQWYCASYNITSSNPPVLTATGSLAATEALATTPVSTPATTGLLVMPQARQLISAPLVSTARPICTSASSDSDGDGFGWENNATCLVTASRPTTATAAINRNRATCASNNSDPDGDGFGWENNATCLVAERALAEPTPPSVTTTHNAAINRNRAFCVDNNSDPDGDGFGWENNATCLATVSTEQSQQPQRIGTQSAITAADITDLILVTGQSNALGYGTSFNARLDAVNDSVFAFTDQGWQVADLHQIWDLNWHPRNHPDGDPSNNFAFHFGKTVADRQSDRVVGFVLVTAPGASISHFRKGGQFYGKIQTKVLDAINQLPHKSRLDGILWHQGESDGRDEQYYTDALYTLINQFRNEPWTAGNAPFICGETIIPAVNRRLNALNTDTDPNTACVRGADLPVLGNGNLHFDATALRTLGRRYATAYLSIRP